MVILLLLLGGGGYVGGWHSSYPVLHGGVGLLGVVLIVVVILALMGRGSLMGIGELFLGPHGAARLRCSDGGETTRMHGHGSGMGTGGAGY